VHQVHGVNTPKRRKFINRVLSNRKKKEDEKRQVQAKKEKNLTKVRNR